MKTINIKKNEIVLILLFSLMISMIIVLCYCSQKPNSNNNPYDPDSENYTIKPQISIISPLDNSVFSYIDSIPIIGLITNFKDTPQKLIVVIKSSKQGVLFSGKPNANGYINSSSEILSIDTHVISFEVTDLYSKSSIDSIRITKASFPPELTVLTPDSNQTFTRDDTVYFQIEIDDYETENKDIAIALQSDKQGIICSDHPDQSGVFVFSTTSLLPAEHQITIQAMDDDSNISETIIPIYTDLPDSIIVHSIKKDTNSIYLAWSPSRYNSSFQSYEIFRDTVWVASITSIHDTTFVDTSFFFGNRIRYTVINTNKDEYTFKAYSSFLEPGIHFDINETITKMLYDSSRSYVYALTSTTNNLLFVNTRNNKIEKQLSDMNYLTDLDIGVSFNYLYVASEPSSVIGKVDLNTQEYINSFKVSRKCYNIACLTASNLVFTEKNQMCKSFLLDTETGLQKMKLSDYFEPDLEASPDGTSLYLSESGLSNSDLLCFKLQGDSLFLDTTKNKISYSNAERKLVMTNDGKYLFFAGRKIITKDFTEVGNFNDSIYAALDDGSVVFSETYIYNGETMEKIKSLPLKTKIMVICSKENRLYLFDDTKQRIYLYNINSLK